VPAAGPRVAATSKRTKGREGERGGVGKEKILAGVAKAERGEKAEGTWKLKERVA